MTTCYCDPSLDRGDELFRWTQWVAKTLSSFVLMLGGLDKNVAKFGVSLGTVFRM